MHNERLSAAFFFFSSRRRHTRFDCDWSSDVCSSDLADAVHASGKRIIWAFWHRIILPIVWWHRNRGVVVMNTTAFDGQWTRKVIEWLGFGTAQGSSSRGGLRGLAGMARRLAEGRHCRV